MTNPYCTCTTFTTEDGRNKLFELLEDQEVIYAAVPFGLSDRLPIPDKVLIRDRDFAHPLAETRLNSNLHAKFLVTDEFVIHGSTNFTENSIRNEHEIMNVTYRGCCESQYQTFTAFFQKLWNRSKLVAGINDTVKSR